MASLDAVFKAYDIRGTVPDQLDADVCRRIGAAFGRFAADAEASTGNGGPVRMVLARDMRPSGIELSAAFAEGAMEQGVDVVELGLASTDLLYFASGHLGVPGAIFTASHNPAGYNGIKMCLAGATPVGEETGLGVIKQWASGGLAPAPVSGSLSSADLLDAFADHVRSFVDTSLLAPLKIVADTANGMGGLVAPAVFGPLGFDVEYLYAELDGTFPNHPADPIQPENVADLRARVLEVGADIGLAFDGDADRVFLIDEQANIVSGSLTTALVAKGLLAKHPGATVLHNLICSKAVPEVIREGGGKPVRTRVGHSFIKQVMAETGAIFGGEHSGHYYFRDNYRADSGLIAALIVLEQLSVEHKPLSALLAPLDRYVASGEINTKVHDPSAVIDNVAAAFAELPQDRLDGLTIDAGSWWCNLRASNTEPLLRLNVEASNPEELDDRVTALRTLIEKG
ncbi:MAG: phosphomannomutase/phosphoglucomutase [Actinobacteria bacterium]|nr:phosphomannomutase/phosphoglucomutase [Actinomycetota bacterium]